MSSDLTKRLPAWMQTVWAKVFGGLLLAMLILALLAPYLLNVDRYRATISDLLSLQTGRQVTMGRLRATILPRVGFSVDGFQMANPPEFAQGQLVSAEEIHGALAFWPLVLRRELRVISLEMTEPRLTLLEDDRGRNNYSFPARRPAEAPTTRQPRVSGEPTSVALMVDQVTMHDAAIFYGTVDRRGRPAATVAVTGLNVELGQLALQPLRVHQWQADALLGGTQLTLAGWNAPLSFDSGSVTLRDGKLDSSFTLQFGKAARVEGTVSVPNIENAIPQFDVKTDDLDLNALVSGASEPAPARGGNLRPALGPALGIGGVGNAGNAARQRTVRSVATDGPSRLVAQGHLAAQRVRQGTYTAGPLSADLRVYNDRTELWPFTLRLADGAVQLTARTDRKQVPQRFSANVQVRNLSAERILQDSPELKGKFAGTAELDLQLIGSLDPQWTRSLTGNGQFAIRNGRIAGFNLTGAAQSIASFAGVNGNTPFTRIAGDLSIRDERVTSREIHMDSPRGTLDLQGSCGFYGSLDYQGRMIAQLGGDSAARGTGNGGDILSGLLGSALGHNLGRTQIAMPFVLRGTVQKPQFLPGHAAPNSVRPATGQAQPSPQLQPQPKNGSTLLDTAGQQNKQ